MFRIFLILSIIISTSVSLFSEITWYYPPPTYPRTEYCQGMCFEIYDTAIGGWFIDTTRYIRHLIIFKSNTYEDTIHVPMRNFRFKYCFQDTGHYSMDDGYTGFVTGDPDSIERCCSGIKITDAMVIKGCPPVANFYNNTDTICEHEYLTISENTLRQPANWQWQFYGSNTEFYNGKAPPNIRYNETGKFPIQLIVSNAYGSDTLVKDITITKCNDCIYSPNAFSPNNDGINDIFKIYSNCILEEFKIQIYNRWANLVFESNDINISWNGEYKNTYAATDVYSYLISYKHLKSIKTEYKKGSLMLLK